MIQAKLQKLLGWVLGPRFYCEDALITTHQHVFVDEDRFKDAYANAVRLSGIDPGNRWRIKVALWAASHALHRRGVFVELGVSYGFTSAAINTYLYPLDRDFYLIDTFKGGRGYNNNPSLVEGRFAADIVMVGRVPEILEKLPRCEIAFLHVDLNNGPVEVSAFQKLRLRLKPGAVVLLDDYSYVGFEDTRKAWDALHLNILPLPTGQGLIIV